MSSKKRGLGRGLSALLEDSDTDITSNSALTGDAKVVGSVSDVAVANIEANPFQPRTHFEKEALIDLANSIKEHGIIQPLTVRKMGFDKYQIISGERRFRAAQVAGLEQVPAYIRIADDQTMLEMAIVENVQREDLDAIEVALGFQRLIDECELTQEELSDRVGKSRSAVTNYLRLLKLPPKIQLAIRERHITMGHARALINAGDEATQVQLLEDIIAEQLSVRSTEERIKERKPATSSKTNLSYENELREKALKDHFEQKVKLTQNNKGAGKLVISFRSDEELKSIMDKLGL